MDALINAFTNMSTEELIRNSFFAVVGSVVTWLVTIGRSAVKNAFSFATHHTARLRLEEIRRQLADIDRAHDDHEWAMRQALKYCIHGSSGLILLAIGAGTCLVAESVDATQDALLTLKIILFIGGICFITLGLMLTASGWNSAYLILNREETREQLVALIAKFEARLQR